MSNGKVQNEVSTDLLCKEYNWYENTFPPVIQSAYDEFFEPGFKLKLIGISKNISYLTGKDSCFVTKIRLDKEYDLFFRLTDKAVEMILNRVLGQAKHKFNINKISELEAKVITSFNDFLFGKLKPLLNQPPVHELSRVNFDLVHLTLFIKEIEDYNKKTGKVIITVPCALINPEQISSQTDKFNELNFPETETVAKVLVGKTKTSLYDIKHLEEDDVVVFDESKPDRLLLTIKDTEMSVKLNPNMDLLIPQDEEGGDDKMSSNVNLWDSIEVEMTAEFDSVKISLGELKSIEQGQVVDLVSLYDNNVTLKVEGRPVANGSLVIVNDKYGVKINNVITGESGMMQSESNNPEEAAAADGDYTNDLQAQGGQPGANELSENSAGSDEEFDYSDFELEDDNI